MRADVSFIADNWMLLLVALVSGGALVWPLFQRRVGGPTVGTLEATQLINKGAVVLDVRTTEEFAAGHIASARNIPLPQLADRLVDVAKNKDTPVVVVCASGARSATAAAQLRKAGHTQVVNLQGGLGAWQSAGLPVGK